MTTALEGVSGQQQARPYFTPGKDPVPIVQEAFRWSRKLKLPTEQISSCFHIILYNPTFLGIPFLSRVIFVKISRSFIHKFSVWSFPLLHIIAFTPLLLRIVIRRHTVPLGVIVSYLLWWRSVAFSVRLISSVSLSSSVFWQRSVHIHPISKSKIWDKSSLAVSYLRFSRDRVECKASIESVT